jgi:hypothetical protein
MEPEPSSLSSVPRELLLYIAEQFLDPAALLRLSEASRGLHSVATSDIPWRLVYRAAFHQDKQRIALPRSYEAPHHLVDLAGQPHLLDGVKAAQLAAIVRERRRRGLIPAGLIEAADLAYARLDADALKQLVFDSFPAFLAPRQPAEFASLAKLSYYVLQYDLERTHITSHELSSTLFEVTFRTPGWLGFPEESQRRMIAIYAEDGTLLLDGQPLRWRFLGDSEGNGSPSRWFSRQARYHSRCTRTVQTEHYSPKSVSRSADGGWVLSNSFAVYQSIERLSGADERSVEVPANQEAVHGHVHLGVALTSGPGILFVKEVAKVIAAHAAVVFGFGFVVAWLF